MHSGSAGEHLHIYQTMQEHCAAWEGNRCEIYSPYSSLALLQGLGGLQHQQHSGPSHRLPRKEAPRPLLPGLSALQAPLDGAPALRKEFRPDKRLACNSAYVTALCSRMCVQMFEALDL